MSAIKNYLENLSVSITNACRNELDNTYQAYGLDSDTLAEYIDTNLFEGNYKKLHSFLVDCVTDLPWDSINLGVDSAIAMLEAFQPQLKADRLGEDGDGYKLCFEGWERP